MAAVQTNDTDKAADAGDVKLTEVRTMDETSVRIQWGQVVEIDETYLHASLAKKILRSVLFQMVLFGA